MIQIVLALGVVVGVLVYINKFASSKKTAQPPGPTPFPLIGNLLQIGRRPHLKFLEWALEYGPIMQLKMGFQNVVVLTDPKIAREILNDNATTGRFSNPVMEEFCHGKGIVNVEGKPWEEQRQFAVGVLRKYGFGSVAVEQNILDEAQQVVSWLKKFDGKVIDAYRMFQAPMVNYLFQIVAGKRFEWEQGDTLVLDSATNFFQSLMNLITNGLLVVPMLRWISPELFGWNNYKQCVNVFTAHLDQAVQEHKENFNENDLRDFIDEYISKINKCKDKNSSFYEETGYSHLRSVILDLFIGGSESISAVLSWIVLYLSQHPDVQLKMQQEIDQVLNQSLPSVSNRDDMPYTQAVICESLRMSSGTAFTLPHKLAEDKVFQGYFFSKGTAIIFNLFGIDHSPQFWENPHKFSPERFLSEDGTKFIHRNELTPFAEGKRRCIGEALAKSTIFIFVASIFQKYTVSPDPALKGEKLNLEPEVGIVLYPKPHKLVFTSR